jgi:transcriptional regulator with XRE-family HTH domain
MRTNNKIIKITNIDFPAISFVSGNGEHRILNLKTYFAAIHLSKEDFGYELLENRALFDSVTLNEFALGWSTLNQSITLPSGKIMYSFFHLDSLNTIKHSNIIDSKTTDTIGEKVRNIRKQLHLSQEELGKKIGISKHYISKIENSRTDLEFKTFQKIVEIGFNKKVFVGIYNSINQLSSLSNSFLTPNFLEWLEVQKHDLLLIDGIESKMISRFRNENIYDVEDLSALNLTDLIEILNKAIEPLSAYEHADSWLIQAKLMVKGEWTALIMLQKTLNGTTSKIENRAKKELNESIFLLA